MGERIINLGEASAVSLNGDYTMIDSATRGVRKIALANLAQKVSVTTFKRITMNAVNSTTSTITVTGEVEE